MSQTEELSRVQGNIGELVERFVLDRWQTGQPRFHIQDLHDYIAARTQIAPASPDRILRQLRLEGKFDYRVVSRSESCYEVTAIGPCPKIRPARIPATKRNPKQEGTNLFDCKPQTGPCPVGCNQCFYNRPGAFYTDIQQPIMPTLDEVGDGIVRVNSGHDSNVGRDEVIRATQKYPRRFFNTSIARFDFPAPVVLTANPREEEPVGQPIWPFRDGAPRNLMFVRLRVSSTNLDWVREGVAWYTSYQLPVVLTFMAYYTAEPQVPADVSAAVGGPCYEWKVRHINSYWCPTPAFIRWVLDQYRDNRLVSYCGSVEGPFCRNCRNCETYYLQTIKRMKGE